MGSSQRKKKNKRREQVPARNSSQYNSIDSSSRHGRMYPATRSGNEILQRKGNLREKIWTQAGGE